MVDVIMPQLAGIRCCSTSSSGSGSDSGSGSSGSNSTTGESSSASTATGFQRHGTSNLGADAPRKLSTRELYLAATSAPSVQKERAKKAGGVFIGCGLSVLAWNNWASFIALVSWNTIGCGLVTIGAAALAGATGNPSMARTGRKKEATKFKLTLLNDTERWKEDQAALVKLLGEKPWPSDELAKARAEEENRQKAHVKDELAKRGTAIKQALNSGEAASVVQEQFRRRTFVFDFAVKPQQEVPRSGGTRKQLEELRDTVNFILVRRPRISAPRP